MSKSVFISKNTSEVTELVHFCKENEIHLHAESLIQFESIPFQINETYDVVFFASIRAAEYFFRQEKINSKTKVACIGNTTAIKLAELGIHVDFIGDKAGKPSEVAQEFKKWLGKRKVLIPQSTISKRSIAEIIPKEQLFEAVVYKTISDCKIISACNTYIFTSPSNFESFLTCNALPKGKIIAWGETTKKCIELKGLSVYTTLEKADLKELITVLS